MLRYAVMICVMGVALGGRRRLRRNVPTENVDQVVRSVSKLINPAQDYPHESDKTLQRLARSPQDYGAPLPGYDEPAPPPPPLPLMPYRYGYAVQDSDCNDFNQQEQSDGDQITGQYSVLLPDGRVQTVTYSVRPETGYVAEVTYSEGVICAPPPPAPAPAAALPSYGAEPLADYGRK